MSLPADQRRLIMAGVVALAVLIAAGVALRLLSRPADVVIGCKAFTESRLLAEIMAQAVERRTGLRVERRELGSTALCWSALSKGAVDAYPEYSGTLLTDILRQPPLGDPAAALAAVRRGLGGRSDLMLGRPFGLNDTYVLAMRRDAAERLGIHRIADLAAHPALVAGFTSEFNQRPDGWPGLAKAYDLHLDRAPVDLGAGHMYQAVRDGQVDLISAFSTDARIGQFGLVALTDDHRFFPAYEAVPLLRHRSGDTGIAAAWEPLAGRIDDATMTALNRAVDIAGEPVAQVASGFLDRIGLRPAQPPEQ